MDVLPFLDGEQLLEELEALAQIGRSATGGINRVAYSKDDLRGRRWIEQKMADLGMTVQTDAVGNTIASYPGTDDIPPIAIGSHSDTVPDGGAYDGALGVLAGLACIRALHTAGLRLHHPVELINFAAEEATMAGGTTGSLGMIGSLNPTIFDRAAWDGRAVREHLQAAGLDPAKAATAARPKGSLAAFVELHVEQSGQLEAAELPIAIVEGIVGIRRYSLIFEGYANHAGTTPMAQRKDALVAAAPSITFVQDLALQHNIVGTVGQLNVSPGAPNVIPGRVEMVVEIRGLESAVLDAAERELIKHVKRGGGSLTVTVAKEPVVSDSSVVEALTAACEQLQLHFLRMPSGAGHDAMNMAQLCPQGMIFVPSKNGVSHSADEYTAPEDCINGARLLLAALIKLDKLL